jgi:hypothetical protein
MLSVTSQLANKVDGAVTPIERFRELVLAAAKAFLPESGADEIVPFGAALVELVRSNPSEQQHFEREFIASSEIAPPELLEFCMHALRWEPLRAHFVSQHRSAIERNDWRAEPYYRHLTEAFEDDWEDARTFYASYFYPAT